MDIFIQVKDFHVALQQSQSVMAKFMAKIPIYDPDIGANCLESRGYGAVLVPVLSNQRAGQQSGL